MTMTTDRPDSTDVRDDLASFEARLLAQADRRDGWTLGVFAFAALAVLFSIVGVAFALHATSVADRRDRAATPPSTVAAPAAATPVHVGLSEYRVQTTATSLAAGKVTLQIANDGTMPHELLVFRSDLAPSAYPMKGGDIVEDGPGVTLVSDGENIDPGQSQTRSVDLTTAGTYLFVCNIPGHFHSGMFAVITVT